jgi:pyridoxine kinase
MNLLSIQSHVAYGHVGNSAAVFPLQRLGVEVWPIHTVQFSNHTGYGEWRGQVFEASLIREVVQGIEERGVLPRCDGVLSGYMGSADTGSAILDAVDRVKAANARGALLLRPGDRRRWARRVRAAGHSRIHARTGVAGRGRGHAQSVRAGILSGLTSRTIAEAVRACGAIHAMGPSSVLVTSLHVEDTPRDMIDMFASGPDGQFRVRTPLLDIAVNGAGDAVAALFFAHYLFSGSTAEALSRSASSIYGLLRRTANAKSREILLVEAQQEFIKPKRLFHAEPVG